MFIPFTLFAPQWLLSQNHIVESELLIRSLQSMSYLLQPNLQTVKQQWNLNAYDEKYFWRKKEIHLVFITFQRQQKRQDVAFDICHAPPQLKV